MTNETVFDVDYFIRKFSAIPEDNWLIGIQGDNGSGKHCAAGWCKSIRGHYGSSTVVNSPEFASLANLFTSAGIMPSAGGDWALIHGFAVAEVNNGAHPSYQQPTPKQRILAALRDIKAKQQAETPTYPDITKFLAILPTEELADKKLKTVKA